MKKKWKYDRQYATSNEQLAIGNLQLAMGNELLAIGNKQKAEVNLPIAYCLLLTAYCLLNLLSCNNKHDEHKHVPTNKTSELDGLVQPSNQTVFSDIKTISPTQQVKTPVLNATGIISYNPNLINNISARFSGRIEKLYVRFNFENVYKGQRIMDIYSPEILTEQQNLIFLLNHSSNDIDILNRSKQKLQLLGVTLEQLRQIEKSRTPINPLPVYNPYNGHIHDIGSSNGLAAQTSPMKNGMSSGMGSSTISASSKQNENQSSSETSALTIKEGMYLERGEPIFAIYNTTQVWAILNIFPSDASQIKTGDKVSIIAETNPDKIIYSTISYIEPVAGENASVIKARVYLQNTEKLHLKIGALLSAKINTDEIYGLWLSRNAVVDLGQKQIVFLKKENHFITRTIQTGIRTDSLVLVISGLNESDEVAVNAQYMVDSESFIKTNSNEQK